MTPRIIESAHLVKDGEAYTTERTWRERWLSRPWRPWRRLRRVVPKVPHAVLLSDGTIVAHPAIAAEPRRETGRASRGLC